MEIRDFHGNLRFSTPRSRRPAHSAARRRRAAEPPSRCTYVRTYVFGRTDLRIGVSRAKKCQEDCQGVRFWRGAPKNRVFRV